MSEITRTARSNWIPIVEYLRGLAALGVTWFHLTNSYGNGWVRASGAYGWLGVEVFFVISGFIIPYSIARLYTKYSIAQFPQFALRRLLRLEPPYLISVVLALALWHLSSMMPGYAGTQPPNSWWQAMAHVAYLIPFTEYQWYNPIYWTLAYEFSFYLVIGITYPWICVKGKPLLWILLAASIAVLVVCNTLPARVLLFVIGIAVFRACDDPSERLLSATTIVFASVIIALGELPIAIVGCVTVGALYYLRHVNIPGVLGRSLLILGKMSYSLYLTHVLIGGRVVNFGRRFIEGQMMEIALSLVAMAVSLIFAYVYMQLIERPAIALARRHAGTSSAIGPASS